eukprot:gene34346-41574_t
MTQHAPLLHNNPSAVELFLFTDVIDTITGVPIAWGASRVLLLNSINGKCDPKSSDTIVVTMNEDVTKFHIQMRLSNNVDGLKLDSSFLLTLEISTTQRLSVHENMHIVRPFPLYNVHWVQGLYPKLDRVYVTIEDILLAPDIMEVYEHRTILVRVSAPSSDRHSFLGSVVDGQGNWLEKNQVYNTTSNLESLLIEVLLVGVANRRWQESKVCQGTVSTLYLLGAPSGKQSNKLVSGSYECELSTIIHHKHSPAAGRKEVTVGKVRVRLDVDTGRMSPDFKRRVSGNSLKQIYKEIQVLHSSQEPVREKIAKVVYLLSKLDSPQTLPLVQPVLEILVGCHVWSAATMRELALITVWNNLAVAVLNSCKNFFEDWLTKDVVNNLLRITQTVANQHMSIRDLPVLSDLDVELTNVRSIQLAICCLMLSTSILKEGQGLEVASDWLTPEYAQEIAADLLTAVVAYKCQLLVSFPTNTDVLALLQSLQDIESYLILYCQHNISVVLDAFVVHANDHLRQVLTFMQLSEEGDQTVVVELILQNLLNTTSYVDQYTFDQYHAQMVMRKCSGHLHHLEEMTKLMDRANSTQFYVIHRGIESVLSMCSHRISSVLERALCIHDMLEESEMQKKAIGTLLENKSDEDRKRSFRNIISCLEFGNNHSGDTPSGHRRPSYVSVSRVTTESVIAGEAGGKKV